MNSLNTIFITGANRGIGLELAKEALAKNYFVIGTTRNNKTNDELNNIQNQNLNVIKLDISNEKSCVEASNFVNKPIDYMVCNAGINNGYGSFLDEDHSPSKMLEVLNVNVIGCILTVRNFQKFLNYNSKIILISSIMGVQQHNSSNATIYRASKAAVNNVMVSMSEEFKAKKITVVSFHPGWVRTDMGGPNATLSAKQSASTLIKSFENLTFEKTGRFYNYNGNIMNF